jgi:hypothetical protein
MSIDSLFERFVVAQERQAAALEKLVGSAPPATAPPADAKPARKARATPAAVTAQERAGATDAEVVPKGNAEPAADEFLDGKKEEAKKPTHDDLLKALQKYASDNNADQKGTAKAKELLKKTAGVAKVADCPEDKIAAVIIAAKQAPAAPAADAEETL